MAGIVKRAGIIFDFDDTLVYAHELFLAAQQEFCRHMQGMGIYDEKLMSVVEKLDIDNVRSVGYMAAECFPLALGQAYEVYCAKYGRTAKTDEKGFFIRLGWQPYELRPRVMEEAHTLLTDLMTQRYGNYRLLLFTQGDIKIQQKRVAESGLANYFHAIKIVPVKNAAALISLVEEQHIEPSLSWYVGNSLRNDINPAIEAGLHAVHFDIDAWSYEHEPPCGSYHTIGGLEEFAVLLCKAG